MLLALEGIAGSGKSAVRDRLLASDLPVTHLGQFSWLSLEATRTIIALRAGRTLVDERSAVDAVRQDLELHARYNLTVTHQAVVADRWALSSVCLLALLYRGTVRSYVEQLIDVPGSQADAVILLNTDPSLCIKRLSERRTARRFGEEPAVAVRLADLYLRAAEEWHDLTGRPVLLRDSVIASDLDALVTSGLEHLRAA